MDETMNKRPSLQFYPADWLKDPDLQMCSMNTIGIWINLVCRMWESKEEGIIRGKPGEIALLIGAKPSEFKQFLREALDHKFADVTKSNSVVTIICRRMNKVFLEREGVKKRVKEHRARRGNENVTKHSSSSTTSSTSKQKDMSIFDKSRLLFKGTKRGLQTEYENFCKHPDHREVVELLLPAVENQIRWRAEDGRYWKNFKTWVNQRCWEETEGADKIEGEELRCIRREGNQRCSEQGMPFRKDDTGQPYFICSKHNIR